MSKVILGLSMSLDGFINDRNGSVERLYPDLEVLRYTQSLQEAIQNTGAVVMGKRAFEMSDPDDYADNYEFQVPIFVVTGNTPFQQPRQTEKLTFTFVPDGVESAIEQAKKAAGEKNVMIIGGANTAQQCLKAGLVDEIDIDILPVLLGNGRRLFDDFGTQPIQLEKIAVLDAGIRTELRFRVIREK
jgi:dihydrofolate reductase